MKIKAIIEKSSEGGVSVYCKEIHGAFGFGLSEDEAKDDFLEVLEEQEEYYVEKNGVLPEWHECEVEYIYDLSGFFEVYSFINASEFAKQLGINPSLMRKYKNKLAFASRKQKDNIQKKYNDLIIRMARVQF